MFWKDSLSLYPCSESDGKLADCLPSARNLGFGFSQALKLCGFSGRSGQRQLYTWSIEIYDGKYIVARMYGPFNGAAQCICRLSFKEYGVKWFAER